MKILKNRQNECGRENIKWIQPPISNDKEKKDPKQQPAAKLCKMKEWVKWNHLFHIYSDNRKFS